MSGAYESSEGHARGSYAVRRCVVRAAMALHGYDTPDGSLALPSLMADLFIGAGALVASCVARRRAGRSAIEEILKRAVDQVSALGTETP